MLHDVQTSGGLLIAVAADAVDALLDRLHSDGDDQAAVVGRVEAGGPNLLVT